MLNMFSLFMHSLHFVLILRERGTEREYNGFHYKNLFNIYNKRGFRLVLDRKSLFPETSHPGCRKRTVFPFQNSSKENGKKWTRHTNERCSSFQHTSSGFQP